MLYTTTYPDTGEVSRRKSVDVELLIRTAARRPTASVGTHPDLMTCDMLAKRYNNINSQLRRSSDYWKNTNQWTE